MATTEVKETKKAANIYYVSPHGEKGWKIIKQGSDKAIYVFKTKAEALERARELGRNQKASVIIKGKDGKIMDSLNYKK
ncbi:DUF2188 domain-containing protein [Ureaplasma ceti]|uniref:DUF2188 domain-containing protein n=1 Tax=Ureaplasma ceti TaxID=3119530 RepID=A0ABP9U861_9BACT